MISLDTLISEHARSSSDLEYDCDKNEEKHFVLAQVDINKKSRFLSGMSFSEWFSTKFQSTCESELEGVEWPDDADSDDAEQEGMVSNTREVDAPEEVDVSREVEFLWLVESASLMALFVSGSV